MKSGVKAPVNTILLAFIIVATIFTRFYQLGYSHLYGDEAKTIYMRKDISASHFLLDQRKGPIQFLAVWGVQKISPVLNEFTIRAPFALASVLTVFVLYMFLRLHFNERVSIIGCALFSLSGFTIAFGRTAQYQSFLSLFGILSLYFSSKPPLFKKYLNSKFGFEIISGLFLGLAFLSHYDAIFYACTTFYILFSKSKSIKSAVLVVIPALLVSSIFYIFYITQGYFTQNTIGYLVKRTGGLEYLPDSSIITFFMYQPNIIYLVLVPFVVYGLIKAPNFLKVWFFVPFVTFQLFINSPGTHIWNYLIPSYIAAAIGVDLFLKEINSKVRNLLYVPLMFIFIVFAIIQLTSFIPALNKGYPWNKNELSSKYQLYLYGFPYYRGWDKVSQYFNSINGVRGYYTNDNPSIAKYYLYKYNQTPIGSNFIPQYYVYVRENQENYYPSEEFLLNYNKVQKVTEYIDVYKVR